MSDLANWATLKAQTDRNRDEFVGTDMKVVATFLTTAALVFACGQHPGHRRIITSQLRHLYELAKSPQRKLGALEPGEV